MNNAEVTCPPNVAVGLFGATKSSITDEGDTVPPMDNIEKVVVDSALFVPSKEDVSEVLYLSK